MQKYNVVLRKIQLIFKYLPATEKELAKKIKVKRIMLSGYLKVLAMLRLIYFNKKMIYPNSSIKNVFSYILLQDLEEIQKYISTVHARKVMSNLIYFKKLVKEEITKYKVLEARKSWKENYVVIRPIYFCNGGIIKPFLFYTTYKITADFHDMKIITDKYIPQLIFAVDDGKLLHKKLLDDILNSFENSLIFIHKLPDDIEINTKNIIVELNINSYYYKINNEYIDDTVVAEFLLQGRERCFLEPIKIKENMYVTYINVRNKIVGIKIYTKEDIISAISAIVNYLYYDGYIEDNKIYPLSYKFLQNVIKKNITQFYLNKKI